MDDKKDSNLNERDVKLLNMIGLRAEDATEEIIKLIKYALASHEFYTDAATYCKKVLQCN